MNSANITPTQHAREGDSAHAHYTSHIGAAKRAQR